MNSARPSGSRAEPLCLDINGAEVEVPDDGATLLDVLRGQLGVFSVKDGCSPQGQCGCCTVLVDGAARVACVTPARRVRGRAIRTIDGVPDEVSDRWSAAFTDTGASQCGFCTPGILMRLIAEESVLRALLANDGPAAVGELVRRSMLAHLCRCTGWQTIVEASLRAIAEPTERPVRLLGAAARRAEIEGRHPQQVGDSVSRGAGGFAEDEAPADALVAVPAGDGSWAVAASLREARADAHKVQGRRTTVDGQAPISLPEGSFVRTLRTTWVEPGYLETDASWAAPGGAAASPSGNGGAFGAKVGSAVSVTARSLADAHRSPVRTVFSREDAVRKGPKRPPIAAGIAASGAVHVRVARTDGIVARLRDGLVRNGVAADAVTIEEVDVAGPPTSADIRAAGFAEGAVLASAVRGDRDEVRVVGQDGGRATVARRNDGSLDVHVEAGEVLDEIVLRSYCIGAVHMGLGWATSEALAVDDEGAVLDLTIRSFGILRAIDMPEISVRCAPGEGSAVNGSDAVFAATAALAWAMGGHAPVWPTRQPWR